MYITRTTPEKYTKTKREKSNTFKNITLSHMKIRIVKSSYPTQRHASGQTNRKIKVFLKYKLYKNYAYTTCGPKRVSSYKIEYNKQFKNFLNNIFNRFKHYLIPNFIFNKHCPQNGSQTNTAMKTNFIQNTYAMIRDIYH